MFSAVSTFFSSPLSDPGSPRVARVLLHATDTSYRQQKISQAFIAHIPAKLAPDQVRTHACDSFVKPAIKIFSENVFGVPMCHVVCQNSLTGCIQGFMLDRHTAVHNATVCVNFVEKGDIFR